MCKGGGGLLFLPWIPHCRIVRQQKPAAAMGSGDAI